MPRYIKDDKLYPGELRIINALRKTEAPLTFTQLINQAEINRVTLSCYLKRLTKKGYVEHDKTSGEYSFPKTFQPMMPSSFPDQKLLKETERLIDILSRSKKIFGKNSVKSRVYGQKALLKAYFVAVFTEVTHSLLEAVQFNEISVAQEFTRRYFDIRVIPRLQLLMLLLFEDKEISTAVLCELGEEQRQRNERALKEIIRIHEKLCKEAP